jgi:hypothetical protein
VGKTSEALIKHDDSSADVCGFAGSHADEERVSQPNMKIRTVPDRGESACKTLE